MNVSLLSGGTTPSAEVRIWVSYTDYTTITPFPGTFSWGPEFDGAYQGSPYGYASVITVNTDVCGIVNNAGEIPDAPPWGTQEAPP